MRHHSLNARPSVRFPFSLADLRGSARLATEAVLGVADVAEAAHATVLRPLGRRRRTRTRGLTGWIYRLVRRLTRRTGQALDGALGLIDTGSLPPVGSPGRDAVVAALNGVRGDALAASGNPLATAMTLRHTGQPLTLAPPSLAHALPHAAPVVLVQVHGICMHDGQWGRDGYDPGAELADGLGATRVALRYNSGRHISENGREFAALLDRLLAAWPVQVRRVVLVGHSMGGLVARSALSYAADAGHAWLGLDVALVTLGSPHHGAPLERIGNVVDTLLARSRWSAPYARIGQIRSAGVTDLRHGNLRDEDWQGRDRFARGPDARRPAPLPESVTAYAIAATTGPGVGTIRDQTVGDGLVPLGSALGRHPDPERDLGIPEERRWVAPGLSHFDLLWSPEVTARLLRWLAPAEAGATR